MGDGTVDFDTVEPCHLRTVGTLGEIALDLPDFFLGHASNSHGHASREQFGDGRRAPRGLVNGTHLLADMIQLQDGLHAMVLDSRSQSGHTRDMLVAGDHQAVLFALAGDFIDEGAFDDDKAHSPLRLLDIESDRPIGNEAVFVGIQRPHRRHYDAVGKVPRTDGSGFEQHGKVCLHMRSSLFQLPPLIVHPALSIPRLRICSIIFLFFFH